MASTTSDFPAASGCAGEPGSTCPVNSALLDVTVLMTSPASGCPGTSVPLLVQVIGSVVGIPTAVVPKSSASGAQVMAAPPPNPESAAVTTTDCPLRVKSISPLYFPIVGGAKVMPKSTLM